MALSQPAFNAALLAFLGGAPTPFHAVRAMRAALIEAGFAELDEGAPWQVAPRGAYFTLRNGSSLIAWRMGTQAARDTGWRLIGAHTDSPCLKLKPQPIVTAHGYLKAGVEVYGGVLLNPWFDRDLALAGRVTVRTRAGRLAHVLIDSARAVAIIPSLAIHLDREANESRSINKQTMLPAVLGMAGTAACDWKAFLVAEIKRAAPRLAIAEVLDFELSFYDVQPPATLGVAQEFIASARLDNLLSCCAGLHALIDSRAPTPQLLVCNDHEEVGSGSHAGARGNFLQSVLQRLSASDEDLTRALARSLLVSTDNAHGVHPNFADRHDPEHRPRLNGGPVVKVNANQSYASNSESVALFKQAAASAKVSLQSFVTRTDLPCGSTIGPLTATALGVRTVDVGVPTFAMHSIRELCGVDDAHALLRTLSTFLKMTDLRVAPA